MVLVAQQEALRSPLGISIHACRVDVGSGFGWEGRLGVKLLSELDPWGV